MKIMGLVDLVECVDYARNWGFVSCRLRNNKGAISLLFSRASQKELKKIWRYMEGLSIGHEKTIDNDWRTSECRKRFMK